MTITESDHRTCAHYTKVRLLGADPRLWQCTRNLGDSHSGCGTLFVEGRSWHAEPNWIATRMQRTTDFQCVVCLDGFCTSTDKAPCRKCGATSARTSAESAGTPA